MKITSKDIITQGLIAAVYFAITMATYTFSFLGIQFRIAEMMLILVFFNKKYSLGLIIGCVLANLTSSLGPIDSLVGGTATVLCCLSLMFSKWLLPSLILCVAFNSFIVGAELFYILHEPFWISCGLVAIGETTVLIVAYIFAHLMKRKGKFLDVINANQNREFKI